ncbi:MAG: hypothetical protein GY754_16000 [bacterium]|nr:hypothetical protein [bacterium]
MNIHRASIINMFITGSFALLCSSVIYLGDQEPVKISFGIVIYPLCYFASRIVLRLNLKVAALQVFLGFFLGGGLAIALMAVVVLLSSVFGKTFGSHIGYEIVWLFTGGFAFIIGSISGLVLNIIKRVKM